MAERKIIVARIFASYNGPTSYYLFDRMRLLPKQRFETICIYLERCSDEPNNQEKFFRCFYLDGGHKLNPLKWGRLAQLLKQEKVDIIHANRHSATVQATVAAWLAGTPVVVSHVHGMNRSRNLRRKLSYKLLSLKVSRMIGISEGVTADIIKNFWGMADKAVHIPNSIDYQKYHNAPVRREEIRSEFNIPLDAFVFVLAARFAEKKGHKFLMDAFSLLLQKAPNAHLLLVGDGPLMEGAVKHCQQLQLENKVTFAGLRNDVPEILKACDAFVLSSIREGFGLVLAESMAAGIPIVVTGVGGADEVVKGAGFYVNERTTENLAKEMYNAFSLTPAERLDLITRADEKVRSCYSHENAVEVLQGVYEDCLNEKGVG